MDRWMDEEGGNGKEHQHRIRKRDEMCVRACVHVHAQTREEDVERDWQAELYELISFLLPYWDADELP